MLKRTQFDEEWITTKEIFVWSFSIQKPFNHSSSEQWLGTRIRKIDTNIEIYSGCVWSKQTWRIEHRCEPEIGEHLKPAEKHNARLWLVSPNRFSSQRSNPPSRKLFCKLSKHCWESFWRSVFWFFFLLFDISFWSFFSFFFVHFSSPTPKMESGSVKFDGESVKIETDSKIGENDSTFAVNLMCSLSASDIETINQTQKSM